MRGSRPPRRNVALTGSRAFADFANLKWETTANLIDNLGVSGLLRAIVRVARANVEHCADNDILMACKWRYVAATLSNTANHIGGL
jgi:hypothetical protein